MSFAQLATREAAIKQSLLLPNILDEIEDTEELQLPVQTEPIRRTIYTPCTNEIIQTTSINTNPILSGDNFQITAATHNNITSTYIRELSTNRWYELHSSTTVPNGVLTLLIGNTNDTACTLIPYQTTTATTTNLMYGNTCTFTSSNICFTNAHTYLIEVNYPVHEFKPKKYNFGIKKTVKNSIKRALKLLDNFGMEEDTKIFLSGNEVEVSHPDSLFKFVITKRNYDNIIKETEQPGCSTPFRLELFTKSGIYLANLCVYAENTPMLDNLMMVVLYVKSGNEEDLLCKANYSMLTKDQEVKEIIALEYPFMKQKLLR